MKKLVLTTAALSLTLAATFNLEAASYSRSYGDSWGNAVTMSKSNNVTVRNIVEKSFATDTGTGGLNDNSHCTGVNCGAADNVASFTEQSVIRTDLTINDNTVSQNTSSTKACFSTIDMNGLSASEGWSISDSAYEAEVHSLVAGTVTGTTKTWTTSGNGGAEYGEVFKKDTYTTNISENNQTQATGGSHVVTFTSSIGYN